ncbi:MAG: ATP-binding cassette domain-containing protein, partial [Rhodospirillaceae bacterium]|nr:ATP-binding cassette domain-containing protein [Rhodospirillaceae bacterium]
MLELSLNHRFEEFRIELEFQAKVASITSLFGRSGTGKTSVINMIAGLTTPDSGFVKVGDDVLFDSSKGINVPPEKRRLGYIFQDSRLFPHMDVRGNLLYGSKMVPPNGQEITFERVVDILQIGN